MNILLSQKENSKDFDFTIANHLEISPALFSLTYV